jgi:hypothetical protein
MIRIAEAGGIGLGCDAKEGLAQRILINTLDKLKNAGADALTAMV